MAGKTRLAVLGAIILSAGLPLQAGAADGLAQCRQVADPAARLACYDQLSQKAEETTKMRQEKQFGLTEQQKAPEERKEAENVSARIQSVGRSSVTLDNGMVWHIEDGEQMLDWIKPGQMAKIARGMLSGYRLTVDGVNGRAVVSRVK